MDVGAWLRGLGLGQYEQAFRDNDIDARVLPGLTANDFKEIGVTSVGHRRLMLQAIAALSAAPAPATPAIGAAETVAAPVAHASSQAERRQLTVMFIDLVGSTALSACLDPEDMRDVLRAYQDAVAGEVLRWDGHVAKFMGDGVLAYFGWPKAHEDDAERAVQAGLALVGVVGRLTLTAGEPLAARVGIATGLVVVGDLVGEGAAREEAVVGETPNLAARLQGVASPGAIVVSELTRRLLGGLFELEDLGPQALKGIAEPVRSFRVVGQSLSVEGRFEAHQTGDTLPLVGRQHELALLMEHWHLARTGKGQVVLLIGEPGIGKSRLVLALRERLGSERRTRLRYQCSSHRTDTPLWPVVEQLERAASFARGDPPEIKLGKIEALLGRALPDPATAIPALAELLSLPANGRDPTPFLTPEQKKAHVFQVLLAQLDGLAAQGPVLMVLEDAHWLDPTTLELFDLVVGRVEQLNVLLIITCRPGFDPPWTGRAHVASLSLARLERHQAAEVVERVTGGRMLPPEVLRQILEKTDGVPLFVEELTKAVLEFGVLRGVGDHYELTGPLPPLAIPSTLQDSLTARLDRSAPLREVAQIGAAIGREFSYELLAAVAARPEDELQNALAQLMSAGLVLAHGQPPEAVYTFKHALMQDAAYATLIRVRRAQIHGQIASSMAERHPDLVRRQPEVLARHLTEAGLTSEAIEHWLKAGQLAAARSATVEAVSHLTNGLGLLAQLEGGIERDRMELEFQAVLGPALNAAKGYAAPETMAAFQRAQELIRQTGDRSRQNAMLTGLFVAYFNRAEFQKAYEVAAEFLNAAERQDDPAPRCIGHRMVAASLNTMGDFRPALPHAEAALAFYDPERHGPLAWHYIHDLGVAALNHLGISLWHAGCVDRSIMCEREALALADRLRHPNSTGYALWYCGVVSAFRRRDFGELQCQAKHLRAYGRDHDLPHWVQFAMCLEGTALAAAGHAEDGITLIQEGIRACEVTHSKAFRPAFLAGLAEAQLWANRWNEAEQTIETALRMSEQTFERWMDAELWRLKGQASAFSGRQAPGETEALFRRAAECAERQGSRPLHLRAVTSLARLWHDQGRGDEARDLLVPIHAWFSDGFDTPDLRDARALLAELRCRELPCRPAHE